MSKPHVTCRIEDAIRQGIILLGKHSSIGPYQSATRQQRFAVIHNREITIYDVPLEAAQRWVAIEGSHNANLILARALQDAWKE